MRNEYSGESSKAGFQLLRVKHRLDSFRGDALRPKTQRGYVCTGRPAGCYETSKAGQNSFELTD